VIVQVNGQPIYNGVDLRNALGSSGGYLRMRIWDFRTVTYVFRHVNLTLP
jgi:hypothetical protein